MAELVTGCWVALKAVTLEGALLFTVFFLRFDRFGHSHGLRWM